MQKVYNVDLALKALEAADYQILGNITSKDIADGHREKTLSLLWQIIYKFRAPRFNAAAKTIQKFWRAKYLTIVVDRRVKEKQDAAAYSQLLQVSAINMQRRFRAKQAMKEFVRLKTAATSIQRKYRATVAMKMQRNNFVLTKTSVIIVQQKWRAIIEMRMQRNYYQNLKQVTTRIQQKFRANRLMKLERDEFQQKKKAATKIQRFYRSYQATKLQRKAFARLRSSVVILQQRFRATLLMRKQQEIFHNSKLAAIKIQRFWRGFEAMKTQKEDFQRIKASTIKMQQRFRAKLSMQKAREDFTTKRAAAVTIQRFWKATIEMRKQREEYQRTVKRVVWIQQRFRAIQSMKAEKEKFTSQKRSAITIQRWFRSYRLMVVDRNKYLEMKKTVLLVENRILANKIMQIERENFVQLRQVAVYIQKRFRSKMETRKTHQQFKETRVMIVKLQSQVRGYQARQRFQEMQTPERIELRQMHKAARSIQAAWRGYQERKNCNHHFRGIVERLIKATKNVDPAQTLASKLKTSINFLKVGYNSIGAISFLAKLEYMSRTVPWILIDDAEFVSLFCYGLMAQAIRSEVDKQIIELCSCIILNLSRYKDTKENAFQVSGKIFSQFIFYDSNFLITGIWTEDNLSNVVALVRQGLRNLQHTVHSCVGFLSLREKEESELHHQTIITFRLLIFPSHPVHPRVHFDERRRVYRVTNQAERFAKRKHAKELASSDWVTVNLAGEVQERLSDAAAIQAGIDCLQLRVHHRCFASAMPRNAVASTRLRGRQNDALHLLLVRLRLRQCSQDVGHTLRLILFFHKLNTITVLSRLS